MVDKFVEHAGDFKNEADLAEELEDEGLDIDNVEDLHYEGD